MIKSKLTRYKQLDRLVITKDDLVITIDRYKPNSIDTQKLFNVFIFIKGKRVLGFTTTDLDRIKTQIRININGPQGLI